MRFPFKIVSTKPKPMTLGGLLDQTLGNLDVIRVGDNSTLYRCLQAQNALNKIDLNNNLKDYNLEIVDYEAHS